MSQNIKVDHNGSKLVITIDTKAARTDSKSGKSEIIGSTLGNMGVGQTDDGKNIHLGVNCYVTK